MEQVGVTIERGFITQVIEIAEDVFEYRVKSVTRDGIQTPAIPSLFGKTHANGARVYFFLFEDGHGAILGEC